MPRRRHTRRQALQLGAAAAAATVLRPSAADASCGPFEMALDLGDAHAAAGWRQTKVFSAPRRFDLIGLGWPRSREVGAQVRARRRGGSWTPWVELHASGDHAPDRGRAASGSDPVFTGAADVFQLRLRGDTRGLRARFVRALPDARRARSRARASRAQQVAPGVSIIPRADWGGDSCPPRTGASYGEVHVAFVHHTVTANGYAPEDSAGIVLGICRYHRNSNGWNDVGYNFLVDQYGQVFEGRAGGVDQPVIGAQAQGYNSLSTGIAVLGDMRELPLTDAALDAIARLLAWKLPLHGAPTEGTVTLTSGGGETNRYPYGRAVTFERISGHRDGNNTTCPGEALYAQLPDLRARVAAIAGPVSRLTLRTASSVHHPDPAELSGRLSFADGSSPAGAPIAVEHTHDNVNWGSLTSVAADATGAWAVTVPLPGSGYVRARFAGDGSRPPLESPALRVKLRPQVSVTRTPVRGRTGTAVRVRGTWAPQPQRGELVVEVQRQNRRGRWRRVERKRIPVSDGEFATIVRAERPGLHRVVLKGPSAVVRRSFRALVGPSTGGTGARRRRR